jgi:hypothetical protein
MDSSLLTHEASHSTWPSSAANAAGLQACSNTAALQQQTCGSNTADLQESKSAGAKDEADDV